MRRARLTAAVLLAGLGLAPGSPAWGQQPGATDLVAAAVAVLTRDGEPTGARLEAIRRLAASHDPRAVEPLIRILEDPGKDVRWAAIEALGDLGDRRAVPPLIESLKRPEAYRWGKRLAANALGAIGDAAAVGPLIALLEDEDPFARRTAALALVRIGDPRGLARVAALLQGPADDTLSSVRHEVARAEADRAARRVAAPAPPPAAQPKPAPARPREWGGLRVGAASLGDAKQMFGQPIQETPDFLLFHGDKLAGPMKAESVAVNGDGKGVVESIVIVPAWGTLDRDVRAVLGPGKVLPYGEYLKSTGRTAYGAGTKGDGKLHFVPQDLVTESYAQMGILAVYEGTDPAARDLPVKFLIVQ